MMLKQSTLYSFIEFLTCIRFIIHNLEIMYQEATLQINVVEPALVV